jgi:hypothetical protein
MHFPCYKYECNTNQGLLHVRKGKFVKAGVDGSSEPRTVHLRRFGNLRRPKRGAGNNDRFARGRSSCKGKFVRKL